jgi:hypothetical protein
MYIKVKVIYMTLLIYKEKTYVIMIACEIAYA